MELGPNKLIVWRNCALVVTAAAGVAFGAEQWPFLESSMLGILNRATGLPVMGMAFLGVGLFTAWGITRSALSFSMNFNDREILFRDEFGEHSIPLADVDKVEIIPALGIGIFLKDSDNWFSSFSGKGQALDRLKATSGVIKAKCKADWYIPRSKNPLGEPELTRLLSEAAKRSLQAETLGSQ